MKKLSVLMLGVLMLSIGMVSATTYTDLCTWTTDLSSDLLPLGSDDNSGCGLSYNTFWSLNTEAEATCVFENIGLENTELQISIDNDVITCTLNGDVILQDYTPMSLS